jgi:hypothetical protein
MRPGAAPRSSKGAGAAALESLTLGQALCGRQQILTDPHAPDEYRGDSIRNLDAWYAAFGVKPGQTLCLEPKERVRVW